MNFRSQRFLYTLGHKLESICCTFLSIYNIQWQMRSSNQITGKSQLVNIRAKSDFSNATFGHCICTPKTVYIASQFENHKVISAMSELYCSKWRQNLKKWHQSLYTFKLFLSSCLVLKFGIKQATLKTNFFIPHAFFCPHHFWLK